MARSRSKKRPTALPDAVRQRVAATQTRVAPGPSPVATNNQAVLVSDPLDTLPEQPQRPEGVEQPPAPIIPSVQGIEPVALEPLPSPTDWYSAAIARVPSPSFAPSQQRGKVAVKVDGRGIEVASQDADVAVKYEHEPAIAPTSDVHEPNSLGDALYTSPAPDLALGMVLWVTGFLCALLLVGIASLGSRNIILIQPAQQGEVTP